MPPNLLIMADDSQVEQIKMAVVSFCASSHPNESCGANGLPLTPNSIRILGRFQQLLELQHPNFCQYVDIVRGKRERMAVVSEYFDDSIAQRIAAATSFSTAEILRVARETLSGVERLHKAGITLANLTPRNMLLDKQGGVRLFNYGLQHMTEGGGNVGFPTCKLSYSAPEVMCAGPRASAAFSHQGPGPGEGAKVDVWALGIVLMEMALGKRLWEKETLQEQVSKIVGIACSEGEAAEEIAAAMNATHAWQNVDTSVKQLASRCLQKSPSARPDVSSLLTSRPLSEVPQIKRRQGDLQVSSGLVFSAAGDRSADLELPQFLEDSDDCYEDPLSSRGLREVYRLWRLAGGDPGALLQKRVTSRPPVHTSPHLVTLGGDIFGEERDESTLLDDSVMILDLAKLRQRLEDVPLEDHYPLLEEECVREDSGGGRTDTTSLPVTQSSTDLSRLQEQPLNIRETDIDYQFHRQLLFSRLLIGYPYLRPRLVREAHRDIPPLYRPQVWPALLDIKGDIWSRYHALDKHTPTSTDRQIEVDIPRCHQYDELLSSPEAHARFKRVLKAWVVSHPQYVYWQGLDSLAAPFLRLNFSHEALAFASLEAFIDKYLHGFFLKDNSAVINEYLATFLKLIAFHDPELSNHMLDIGFTPSLFAIPWFLTMYAHVFPLRHLYHVWDKMLLGTPDFPLCIAVAIVYSMRQHLLDSDFNECILTFSDMPEIDMEKVVQLSVKVFRGTPRSVMLRQHGKPPETRGDNGETKLVQDDLINHPPPREALQGERCPRMSYHDLRELGGLGGRAPPDPARVAKLLVIDIRTSDEYERGAVPGSENLPEAEAVTSEGPSAGLVALMTSRRHAIKVVVGTRDDTAVRFAERLVELCYTKVCVLHRGVEALKGTGILVVPSPAI